MKKSRKFITSALVIAIALLLNLFAHTYAGASNFKNSGTAEAIAKKSYWHSLYTCYSLKNGGDKSYYKKSNRRYNANGTDFKNDSSSGWGQIDSEIEAGKDYSDTWGFSYRKLFPNHNAKNSVYLPNGLTPAGDDSSNCAHVINGDAWDGGDGFKDTLYDRVGKSSVKFEKSATNEQVKNFMEGMGYTRNAGEGTTKCIKWSFRWKKERYGEDSGAAQADGDGYSNSICFEVSNGQIGDMITYESSAEYTGYLQMYSTQSSYISFFVRPTESTKLPSDTYECEGMCVPAWVHDDSDNIDVNTFDRSWDDFVSELKNDWASYIADTYAYGCESFKASSGALWWYKSAKCEDKFALSVNNPQLIVTDGESADAVWKINDDRDAAAQSAFTYLGGTSKTAQKLTDSQRVVLYQYYLADLADAVVKCDVTTPESTYIAVKWFNEASKRQNCYITLHGVNDKEYNIAPDGYFGKPVKFDDLVAELNGISISKLTGVDDAIINSSVTENQNTNRSTPETEAPPDCYSNSGSLGWVLCPIIEGGGKAISEIYENYITPFLVLDTSLFQSGEGTTYSAWVQFQGYANIVFIAVFLVVIISQMTGYGIDNYGIKKILPKLIVAAILINLSYIICQVAVDIANIAGYGIKSIFDGVGNVKLSELELTEAPGAKNPYTATAIIVVLIGLLTTTAILAKGWGVLVPVFLAVIGIIIGIITLFVLLAMRKALAIVLVVISPLAFVAYMLPNTKKMFDRWLSAFKATLLAFPICSLMVFGGQAVARIVLSVGGSTKLPSAMALSAAAMSIAPVFLIPSVLRKSLGAISGMIDRVSGRVGHFAKGRAANSRGMRYLQKQGEQRAMARQSEFDNRRAGRTLNRMNNRMAKSGKTLGDMSASQRRKYMAATGTVSGHDREMQGAYALSFANSDPDSVVSSFEKMVSSGKYDKNLAAAAVQKLADTNQHDKLNAMLGSMSGSYMSGVMTDADKTALGNQLAGLKGQNVAAGLYGKRLAASKGDMNLESYMKSANGFNVDVANAGKNIISSQDDSTLKYIASSGGAFTEEQMRNSVGNLDTKQQNAVNSMWSNMSDADAQKVFSGMSTEQYAKVDENLAAAVGGGDLDAGRTLINSATTSQRQALMSEDGVNIRSGQNASQQAISDWSKAGSAERASVMAGAKDWASLTQAEKDAHYNSMPQHSGESIGDYQARVIRDYTANAATNAAKAAGYKV